MPDFRGTLRGFVDFINGDGSGLAYLIAAIVVLIVIVGFIVKVTFPSYAERLDGKEMNYVHIQIERIYLRNSGAYGVDLILNSEASKYLRQWKLGKTSIKPTYNYLAYNQKKNKMTFKNSAINSYVLDITHLHGIYRGDTMRFVFANLEQADAFFKTLTNFVDTELTPLLEKIHSEEIEKRNRDWAKQTEANEAGYISREK
ncbi:hypothetical protein [Terribacillus saccharophilus]|uniref:hypothetical protein n=1 Tax=Terribacillus saccharophilus TaxID=361277 RepID=UPI002989AB2F|nr:hypothetical protein [Terribacillus saccharophilus]MCM3227505.1 hypothetical protein [Terribacillus saccharophilus]